MGAFKLFALATACALAFSFCDTLAAHWAKNGSRAALAATVLLGPVAYLIFGYINTHIGLAVAGGLVNALVVVFTALAGILLFGETDLSHWQLTGLGLIVVGVILVTR